MSSCDNTRNRLGKIPLYEIYVKYTPKLKVAAHAQKDCFDMSRCCNLVPSASSLSKKNCKEEALGTIFFFERRSAGNEVDAVDVAANIYR